jgi:tetratricopeptide (TPR) repeat protein
MINQRNSQYFKVLTILLTLVFAIYLVFKPLIAQGKDNPSSSTQVQLLDNLGNYHHPISTSSQLAQRYFDQGLTLAYGFNHLEAKRYFQQAAQLDPNCAMCYWGIAYVLGPNINAPMAEEVMAEAWQNVQKAIALKDNASKSEQAYIEALAQRYSEQPGSERIKLDLAYAQAMAKVAQENPEDLDAATIFAEALMDTMPWDYWQENGEIKPEAAEILTTLEKVLKKNPFHPGANHLYIHAVEKENPPLAVMAADHLLNLVPDSGHLVHMPSHIYIRVGRYHDAVVANQKAIAADQNYLQQNPQANIYTLAYVPHNHHFLWFAALMTGQSKLALEAAKDTAKIDKTMLDQPDFAGALQHFYVIPLYTLVRFSQWDEILATPSPEVELKYPKGIWHYARGMAWAAQQQTEKATEELVQLQTLLNEPELEELKIWGFNSTASILAIASEVLAGEIASQQQDYAVAIKHLQKAITLEDDLVYTEPPDWYSSTRNLLGLVLLQAQLPQEAEEAFRQDLAIYPWPIVILPSLVNISIVG